MRNEKKRDIHQCTCDACRQHPRSSVVTQEHRALNRVLAGLDEKNRRRFDGILALQWGRGSVIRLHEISGLSRTTIRRGRDEIQHVGPRSEQGRLRKAGGGRKAVEKTAAASECAGRTVARRNGWRSGQGAQVDAQDLAQAQSGIAAAWLQG